MKQIFNSRSSNQYYYIPVNKNNIDQVHLIFTTINNKFTEHQKLVEPIYNKEYNFSFAETLHMQHLI